MSNYKIKVNSEAESKEAQELFFQLGYSKGVCSEGNYPADIVAVQRSFSSETPFSSRSTKLDHEEHKGYKELTLSELRDMVVLKRNDVEDATHQDKDDAEFKYRLINNQWHVITNDNQAWRKSSVTLEESPLFIKPIEKTMKEYLIKTKEGEYHYINDSYDTCPAYVDKIKIPEGCNVITREYRNDNIVYFHWKSLDSDEFFLKDEKIWSNNFGETLSNFIGKSEGDAVVIWQRPTQPEELPFIDDEPKYTDDEVKYMDDNGQGRLQLINDQYAEIEQFRQHSHYKKDVSNLEFIDVYRVLKLFDVTDPCLQHAIKKLLCSGQRGAKSSDQDVQEAVDSLVRFQQMRIEDSLD